MWRSPYVPKNGFNFNSLLDCRMVFGGIEVRFFSSAGNARLCEHPSRNPSADLMSATERSLFRLIG